MNTLKNKKAVVFIASEKISFMANIANLLQEKYGYEVLIAARDSGVIKSIENFVPSVKPFCIDTSLIANEIGLNDVVNSALAIENHYGRKMSLLISEDRAIGQGYLSNAQGVPHIIRSLWPHKKKLTEVLTSIKTVESIVKDANLVIQVGVTNMNYIICNKNNIPIFGFRAIKFGSRMFWSDDPYNSSSNLKKRLEQNIAKNHLKETEKYKLLTSGKIINESVKYSLKNAVFSIIRIIFNDTKNWVRLKQKKNSYRYLGWLPVAIRNYFNYRFIRKNGVTISDVEGYKILYFALHLEPEIALISYSPEFSNSMEAITWISKSLPSDYMILVKEQALSYGIRSRWYYNQLCKMPNVLVVKPNIESLDLINRSDIVATITGTIGQEAVQNLKPVLSFGKHQVINYLPTVKYVASYSETREAINEIMKYDSKDKIFVHSKKSLSNAQIDSSIDFPVLDTDVKLTKKEVDKALQNLFDEYPNL